MHRGAIVLGLCAAFLTASDLIDVKSARILEENRLVISADLHHYSYAKSVDVIYVTGYYAGDFVITNTNAVVHSPHVTYEYLYLPFKLQYGLANLFEFDVTFPIVAYRDSARANMPGATGPEVIRGFFFCDTTLEARMRFNDYDNRAVFNLAVSVQLPTGASHPRADAALPSHAVIVATNAAVGSIDPNTIGESDYSLSPFSRGVGEFAISCYYTKEWIDDLLMHINFSYIYELEPGEVFWQPEDFVTMPPAGSTEPPVFKFFGIEKLLKKLFWTWSRTDPWMFRRNDAIKAAIAFEYQLDTPLTIGDAAIDMSYKFFLEISGTLMWDQSSSRRNELTITPGAWIKLTRYARLLVGYTFVILDREDRYYNQRFSAGIRVIL
ncbi:MAG: hypothetical protein AABZ39_12105 [Spirochaetota bacterium]